MVNSRILYKIIILFVFTSFTRQVFAVGMDWENNWQAGKQLLQDGQYQKSIVLIKKSVNDIDTAEETEKPSDIVQSAIYMDLAKCELLIEQYQLAENYINISLQKVEKARGKNHPDVAKCLSLLALVCAKEGKYKDAEDLYSQVINITTDAFGANYYLNAEYRNQLGRVYYEQRRYIESEGEYKKSIEIVHSPGAREIKAYIDAISALSLLYYKTKSTAKIGDLFQKAIDTVKRTRGKEHPDMAVLLAAEANTYFETGDVNSADKLLRQAIAIHENALGPTDLGLSSYWIQLIKLCISSNRLSQAEEYAKQTIGILQRKADAQFAELLSLQATIQFKQGKLLDARENAKKSKELYVSIFGEKYSKVVFVDDLVVNINSKQ